MPDLVLKQKCKSLLTDDGRWMPSDGNSSPGLSSLSILFQSGNCVQYVHPPSNMAAVIKK
jgi:hypothetical protein